MAVDWSLEGKVAVVTGAAKGGIGEAYARTLAEAVAELLFKQQKNWAFVDKPLDALEAQMRQTGMSAETFKKCLDDKELYQNVIKVNKRGSEKFNVQSTPTFFINGERRIGTIPLAGTKLSV